MKIGSLLRKYPTTFWVANLMELLERWAWYGFYMLFALYLTNSTDEGALGFSQTQKGLIMGIGTAFLYLLPIITGALSDRIGYRKTLYMAYTIYSVVFLMMPWFRSFVSVFMIYLLLATGGALFKPIIAATVAKTTDEETSSIGFGLFYMMVNIGAFIGPFVTGHFRKYSWDYVFYASALVIATNFILVTLFYKEPVKNAVSAKGPSWGETVREILNNIGKALSDWRFAFFLFIISGFWAMYLQFYMTLPVFIEQWVDTRSVYQLIHHLSPWLAGHLGTSEGAIPAEYLMNVDAGYIILFQILISALVMRFKPLQVMTTGIIVASIGLGLSMATQNGLFILVALLIFSVGEMASSPKITEYIGRIAPEDKTALYIGCSYLPLALGNIFAGLVSGKVYQQLSDKVTLAQHEVAIRQINLPALSAEFTKNDYFRRAASEMQMNPEQFTQFLWSKYHPGNFWIIVTGIGITAATILWLYDRLIHKKE